jgi:hypothetical protein
MGRNKLYFKCFLQEVWRIIFNVAISDYVRSKTMQISQSVLVQENIRRVVAEVCHSFQLYDTNVLEME